MHEMSVIIKYEAAAAAARGEEQPRLGLGLGRGLGLGPQAAPLACLYLIVV